MRAKTHAHTIKFNVMHFVHVLLNANITGCCFTKRTKATYFVKAITLSRQ